MTIPEALQIALQKFHAGQIADAGTIAREVLSQMPTEPTALNLLGLVALHAGQAAAAADLFARAIGVDGKIADFHGNRGLALALLGRTDESIESLRRALVLRPAYPEALFNLADTLCVKSQWKEAISVYGQAAALRPHDAVSHRNLGYALMQSRKWQAAVEHCRASLAIEPNHSIVHNTLGLSLYWLGEIDSAKGHYEKAIELKPDSVEPLNNLANFYRETGQIRRAIECYERALAIDPGHAGIASNRLYAMHYDADFDAPALLREHQAWDRKFAQPLRQVVLPHGNDRSPDRRLRIGYVSPDLKSHVVGVNLLPLLNHHDHSQFEIFAYASVATPDSVTESLLKKCDMWRDVLRYDDEQLAQIVRADGIDILVDLTQHMAHNRLLVFARKPAPVQVSYLGYCSTTGLATMDHRFSDPHLDPPGTDLSCYSEETVRLPRSYWAYQPGSAAEAGAAPCLSNGFVTFGCLNSFAKVSPEALTLWAQVMRKAAGSKLILHCRPGAHRNAVLEIFDARGVGRDRIEFVGFQHWPDYIQTYQRIDVALDPFPYGGGITSCDALWMGVPVVTLSGRTAVGRGGRSLLSNLGLPELVAQTPQEYADLAGDSDRWIQLRPHLRGRMLKSPLMDGHGFARDVEAAYRQMWRNWAQQSRTSVSGGQE